MCAPAHTSRVHLDAACRRVGSATRTYSNIGINRSHQRGGHAATRGLGLLLVFAFIKQGGVRTHATHRDNVAETGHTHDSHGEQHQVQDIGADRADWRGGHAATQAVLYFGPCPFHSGRGGKADDSQRQRGEEPNDIDGLPL